MTDLDALLAAVIANRGDDTPRLLYADELQARGEPGDDERAEFIRVQCELARMCDNSCIACKRGTTDGPCCFGREGLRRRERELWTTRREWFDLLGHVVPCLDGYWQDGPTAYVRRGFADEFRGSAADFLANADALVWREGQTVECGGRPVWSQPKWQCVKCGGFDAYQMDEGETHRCAHRVPRPMPATAQPVTRVVLTTHPEDDAGWGPDWVTTSRIGNKWRCAKWPGIEFEVPERSTV